MDIQPRFIEFKDAAHHLGIDKNRFNTEVRHFLSEIRIASQGIAFDGPDLDAFADDYKCRNGRPSRQKKEEMSHGARKDTRTH